mgnify:CR=1 FL=1
MHEEPLLTVAPASIAALPEFYAVAFHQAELAARHYSAATAHAPQSSEAVGAVFGILASREAARANAITKASVEACDAPPDLKNLPATFEAIVPAQEVSDITQSRLSTPYAAWALAVRHRRRAFIYWTYVAALTKNAAVRTAAELLAKEALSDGNELRQQRRLAWQSEHGLAVEDQQRERDASAALLESLLRRDVIAWSQTLPSSEGKHLLRVGMSGFVPGGAPLSEIFEPPVAGDIEQIKQRALRRAEQLSNTYLDDAERAKDQSSLEFAQELATRSIARLAGLRASAASSSEKTAR